MEIKIRAWIRPPGSIGKMMHLSGLIKFGEGWISGGRPEYKFYELRSINGGFETQQSVNVETMIWIGICDENKIEIFEGDVVVHIQNKKNKKNKCIVKFNAGGFVFKDAKGDGGHTPFINGYGWCPYVVIGNIYENPELLK